MPILLRAVPRSRAVLVACMVAGVAGSALLRNVQVGVNFVLFAVLAAAVHASFARSPSAPSELRVRRMLAVACALVASAPIVLRDSEWARTFAVPMTFAWLLLAPRFVERGASIDVFDRAPARFYRAFVRSFPALRHAARLPLEAAREESEERGAMRSLVVGLALGIPSAVVFMTLFSFDAKFAHALASFVHGSDGVLSFAWAAAIIGAALMVLVTVEELRPRERDDDAPADGPTSSGGAFPYRVPLVDGELPAPTAPAPRRFRVPAASWVLVLLQVAGVFALYVSLHARDLFAGHARVRTTPGVTYAGDVHAGFFALLIAVGLAVGLVLTGHAFLATARANATASTKRALMASELLLLALTAPTLVSCAQKLALYVDAYGQTFLRLGVAFVIVLTFPILVLTAIRAARPSWRRFGAWATLVALVGGTGVAFFDADAHVARVNTRRALQGAPFDADYVSGLGSSALIGMAAALPEDVNDGVRFRELVAPIALRWEDPPTDWRAFRVRHHCGATLGEAICSEARAQELRVGARSPEREEDP